LPRGIEKVGPLQRETTEGNRGKKGFKDYGAKFAVFLLKPLLPDLFQLITVVIDDPVERSLLGAAPGKGKLLFPVLLPCGLHIGGID